MTCRVQADPAGAIPVSAPVVRLELTELSFMGTRTPESSSRSVTVGLRHGDKTALGLHTESRRLLDCVFHAMMAAVRALGLFSNGEVPTMTVFSLTSCSRGAGTDGDFSVVLEYRGGRATIQLRSDDIVDGSFEGFLAALNALLFDGGDQPATIPVSSTPPEEDREFIGTGCE